MRKIFGMVLIAVVLVPLSLARGATEVMRFPANNTFANAISNDPSGVTTGVFVSRNKGSRGGVVDQIFVIISQPDGTSTFFGGTLPAGAFHVDAHAASLEVDIHDITLTSSSGEIPADGVVSIDWTRTSQQRMSGSVQFNFGNVHAVIAGTRLSVTSKVDGDVFGVPLVAPFGEVDVVTQSVIVITKN
ncbi:MAG TPA: hypothetical protein VKQ32_03475 [Polyangia bacterium]|nr:hypothetical protein [Polyangia bacterium]